jgi:hypothetical protein
MKLKFMSTLCLVLGLGTLSACSQESKVKSSVQNHVGSFFNTEFDKTFGANNSKIMGEMKAAFQQKMKVEVTDLRIEGDTATGQINVTHFTKDFGVLMLLVGMGAEEHDAKGRSVANVMDEVRAKDPKIPKLIDLPTEVTTRNFKAERQNGIWVVTEPIKF